KPILYDELQAAINKFKGLKSSINDASPINQQVILDLINGKSSYKQRFLVKMGTRIQYRNTKDVSLFYAEDKICHLFTSDGKKYLIDHTLEVLENDLLDPKLFFRVSRQAIVNINAIKEARTDFNRMEILLNIPLGDNLVVSRSRVKEFKDWLNG
ncbi:MAG: LytTR family DNA-binding domain-containing protein, partial [Fulvivirga sp.]